MRGWTQALAGVVGAADPIIPRGPGDQQAAGVGVAVPVLRSPKAQSATGRDCGPAAPPGPSWATLAGTPWERGDPGKMGSILFTPVTAEPNLTCLVSV